MSNDLNYVRQNLEDREFEILSPIATKVKNSKGRAKGNLSARLERIFNVTETELYTLRVFAA